jgi:CheY-like chemotaxis protein
MISADATPGHAKRLIAAGAHAFLTKQINVRDLLDHIDLRGGT